LREAADMNLFRVRYFWTSRYGIKQRVLILNDMKSKSDLEYKF
jgi:hypothetical protein